MPKSGVTDMRTRRARTARAGHVQPARGARGAGRDRLHRRISWRSMPRAIPVRRRRPRRPGQPRVDPGTLMSGSTSATSR